MARVLIVEDEAIIAMDVAAELEGRDHEVIGPFGREADALAALEADAVDVALLDVNLGRDTSFALADALTERKVPVIFLSGHDRTFLPERHRARPLLSKPVLYARLLAAIEAARGDAT